MCVVADDLAILAVRPREEKKIGEPKGKKIAFAAHQPTRTLVLRRPPLSGSCLSSKGTGGLRRMVARGDHKLKGNIFMNFSFHEGKENVDACRFIFTILPISVGAAHPVAELTGSLACYCISFQLPVGDGTLSLYQSSYHFRSHDPRRRTNAVFFGDGDDGFASDQPPVSA